MLTVTGVMVVVVGMIAVIGIIVFRRRRLDCSSWLFERQEKIRQWPLFNRVTH
jgi:hypothetical protein